MDPTDLSLMEAAGLQIDTRITNYHEQKKALGRSLHPDQIDFFLTYPKIARWFFENPREETIAMVFTDICGYTDLTRKLGDPRKTIEGARNWILKEKELTLKHGGFFDKEVGDCAVSLFGPPFCAISLDALQRVQSIEEIKELIRNNQSEPHLYAYQAIMYALESLEVVKTYSIGKHQLNISVGVEVGDVAIGDLTGDIGKLTAMGDSMNLAARLQGFAKQGQIIIGPNCARLIRIYKKESYHSELPFDVVKSGQARLKGYTDKITYYQVTPKKDTNQFF
jgi:class 3 adenylate cyclase